MDTTTELPVFEIVMGLFGGLALFLYGMEQMTDALKLVAGESMRRLLGGLTKNRFLGAMTGAIVTAVIQSSSVTTVLVVGFITAGIMSLPQSVSVIMGANVGTTITAQIVAFKITKYALLLVAVGFGLLFAVKKEKAKLYGAMIMGLGLIFFGMGLMSDATGPLRSYEPFIELMKHMSNPVLGILVGAAFTALVQSSSATTGIVIVLATQGFISLDAGIALAFGANVGTCITALLAALGKPRPAVQAAVVHVLFNVVGVAIWIPFIGELAEVVRDISPAHPDLEGAARLAAETPRQIANAHTTFNIANTLLFLAFTGVLAKLVQKLVPEKPEVVPERARPKYLDEVLVQTPALALDRLRMEIVRLGRHLSELDDRIRPVIHEGDREQIQSLVDEEAEAEQLYESIVAYIRALSQGEIDEAHMRRLSALTSVATHVQHYGETLATKAADIGRQRLDRRLTISEETRNAFGPLGDKVRHAFNLTLEALDEQDPEKARQVLLMKPAIQELGASIRDHLSSRLASDAPDRLVLFRIENDGIEMLLRLYYFSKKIAKTIIQEAEADTDEPVSSLASMGDETVV